MATPERPLQFQSEREQVRILPGEGARGRTSEKGFSAMSYPEHNHDPDYCDDDETGAYWDEEDDICIDCQRTGSMMDVCGVCGATMCFACFEMGAGVCKGPHR